MFSLVVLVLRKCCLSCSSSASPPLRVAGSVLRTFRGWEWTFLSPESWKFLWKVLKTTKEMYWRHLSSSCPSLSLLGFSSVESFLFGLRCNDIIVIGAVLCLWGLFYSIIESGKNFHFDSEYNFFSLCICCICEVWLSSSFFGPVLNVYLV